VTGTNESLRTGIIGDRTTLVGAGLCQGDEPQISIADPGYNNPIRVQVSTDIIKGGICSNSEIMRKIDRRSLWTGTDFLTAFKESGAEYQSCHCHCTGLEKIFSIHGILFTEAGAGSEPAPAY
jgi:hypothetical protein